MLKRLVLITSLLGIMRMAQAQDSTLPAAAAFDSAALLNDLLSLFDTTGVAPARSYTMLSMGVTNRLFSLRNNRLNAGQATTSTLVYTPSAGYYHKSGLSLSVGASLLDDLVKGFRATQFSITPAFDLTGSRYWQLGVSYTYFHITDRYSVYASPVQHDLYAQASYNKGWLQPGLAVGYSTGKFTEIFSFKLPGGNLLVDTGNYRLNAFSLTASVGHDFDWEAIFTKSDALSFTPTLMLNLASDSTRSLSHTIGPNLLRFLSRNRRIPRLQGKNSFRAQSVGMSLNLTYSTGKWSFMPQCYLDYYLPATDQKRLATTFAVTAGYSF